MNPLAQKKCKPCEGGVKPFTAEEAKKLLKDLKGWALENGKLAKTYPFQNYYETMAFVNALAWISHREDHHPDLGVHYNKCRVEYSTHAIGRLSENDFICAAKSERLFEISSGSSAPSCRLPSITPGICSRPKASRRGCEIPCSIQLWASCRRPSAKRSCG